jgi:hypothetical protein
VRIKYQSCIINPHPVSITERNWQRFRHRLGEHRKKGLVDAAARWTAIDSVFFGERLVERADAHKMK